MTQQEVVDHWFLSAEADAHTAHDLFTLKHYDWTLFLWHLVIEKVLKGIITSHGEIPPPIHDLRKLAVRARIQATQQQKDQLKEITAYNLEARYDDYKRRFYKKATHQYASTWTKHCEKLFLWLKKLS